MSTQQENLFANAISIEKMEPRLELSSSSKSSVSGSVSGSSNGGVTGTVTVTVSF